MTDTFSATVRAPQGGPIYTHDFEGNTVSDVLRTIANALDLDGAERVDIAIVPGYRAEDEVGYRCTWLHPNGRDHMVGEKWPDRDTAEWMAETLRGAGMLNVQIERRI